MIFVTTGTHPVSFDRLILAMENFAGESDEQVIIQAGTSKIPIQHAQHLTFIAWDEALQYIQSARVVVTHAGVGTIIDAISVNVPVVVWPRLAHYGEVINNHQLELAEVLSKQGRITQVNNAEELYAALKHDNLPLPRDTNERNSPLVQAIRASLSIRRKEKSRG